MGALRSGITGVCGIAAAFAFAMPAAAQVIEVRPDGATVTYSGPGVFSDAGVRPLREQPQRRSPRAPVAIPPPSLEQAFESAAVRQGISGGLVKAVAWQESRFRADAVSSKGARGVMQLMPATADSLGVDADDPFQNIEGGAAYLARMLRRFGGDLTLALAAYNAGPEAVARHGGVPPFAETRAYVASVLDHLAVSAAGPILTGSP